MAHEVGRFFADLRRAFRVTQAQIAAQLSTRIDIIAALETGQVRALPPWPETCRIVRSYAALAGLDPRPALASLEMLLQAEVYAPAPKRAPAPRRQREPALAAAGETVRELWEGRVGQAIRMLVVVTVPVTIILLVTQTAVLEAAVAKLPPSVARIVRGAQNYVIVQFAPVRDGLRWIDVPDPRSRRSDKLRTTAQSE
jgi:cytoskeletal protein RodZ